MHVPLIEKPFKEKSIDVSRKDFENAWKFPRKSIIRNRLWSDMLKPSDNSKDDRFKWTVNNKIKIGAVKTY